jgi:uncharacterized protein (DUF1778 family)
MYGNLPYTRPMTESRKSERLELRLTRDQKVRIEQAAALSGRTVTDFSVSVLAREADEAIRSERELYLSQKSWDAFNEILNRPAKPVSGLADLLKRPSVFSD